MILVMSAEHAYPLDATPRLYGELASWFHLVTAPETYGEEAAFYRRVITDGCDSPRTLLELGSGGGNSASHLKEHFDMTLVDLAGEMLAISRALNPGCEHLQGDMRAVRLGREFDAVFVHDAIMYMLDESDLRRCMETAFVHCRRGGVAVFAPDCVRESFREGIESGGHDAGGRSLRYMEWSWDPEPGDTTFEVAMVYMLRDAAGGLRIEPDRHRCGLFPRDTWLTLLSDVGFEARMIPDEWNRENFVGTRPLDR
jgi:SAM-dependent methyltransferase